MIIKNELIFVKDIMSKLKAENVAVHFGIVQFTELLVIKFRDFMTV